MSALTLDLPFVQLYENEFTAESMRREVLGKRNKTSVNAERYAERHADIGHIPSFTQKSTWPNARTSRPPTNINPALTATT